MQGSVRPFGLAIARSVVPAIRCASDQFGAFEVAQDGFRDALVGGIHAGRPAPMRRKQGPYGDPVMGFRAAHFVRFVEVIKNEPMGGGKVASRDRGCRAGYLLHVAADDAGQRGALTPSDKVGSACRLVFSDLRAVVDLFAHQLRTHV